MSNDSEMSTELTTVDDVENEMKQVLQNRRDDYEYSRELMYASAERLQDILEAAVDLARESEHPRAIEVATNTANALGDIASKMMKHHLDVEKLNNPNGNNKVDNSTTNNLNVKMNAADLLEMIKKES